VIAAHPRTDFEDGNPAGIQRRHEVSARNTTFGTMNDDVLAHFDPTFKRGDFVGLINANALPS